MTDKEYKTMGQSYTNEHGHFGVLRLFDDEGKLVSEILSHNGYQVCPLPTNTCGSTLGKARK